MDETNVVTETGLDEAVSYTKGCYIGQEIIARIKYRGHVAKKLVGLAFDRAVKIDKDSKIKSTDDKEIGRVTSTTLSPHLGFTIALGYVKYDYIAPRHGSESHFITWRCLGKSCRTCHFVGRHVAMFEDSENVEANGR